MIPSDSTAWAHSIRTKTLWVLMSSNLNLSSEMKCRTKGELPCCFLPSPSTSTALTQTPALGFHSSSHHPPNKSPSKFPRWKVFLQLAPRARVTDVATLFPHKCMLGVFSPTELEVPHSLCPFLLMPLTFKSF